MATKRDYKAIAIELAKDWPRRVEHGDSSFDIESTDWYVRGFIRAVNSICRGFRCDGRFDEELFREAIQNERERIGNVGNRNS